MLQHAYLTKVSFNPDKKEILVEFSNKETRIVKRYPFFPFFVLPKEMGKEKITELLLGLGFKKFSVTEDENLHISAAHFFELKQMAFAIAKATDKMPVVVEPERAFLIQQKWTYFDSFSFENNVLEKISSEKEIGFFITPEIPFNEALSLNEEETLFLVKQSAFSSLLLLPLNKVPSSPQEKTEVFLENIFFKKGFTVSWKKSDSLFNPKQFAPTCSFDSFSTIDFSLVWVQLLSKNFFNIGHDTLNCDCCKPIKLNDKNVLPSSRIEIVFNEDYFFYESSSDAFALNFHKENDLKEKRLEKKKEFFMKMYPVGPFFSGQKEKVPLSDAKMLLDTGKVSLEKNHLLQWFCTKKESFLSEEIRQINTMLFNSKQIIESVPELFLSTKKVGAYYTFFFSTALSEIASEIPFQLTNNFSRFSSYGIAKAILSIQEETLFQFKKFSEKKGYRILFSDRKNVFVKGFSSLALAKGFSKELSLPQPIIKGFAKKTRVLVQ